MCQRELGRTFLALCFVYGLAGMAFGQGVYEAWVAIYNGPGNGSDGAHALAVDNNGNAYVTGYSWGSLSATDYATIKYAPNGDTLWVRRYNGPGNDFDRANALAVDTSGNVYVTGRCDDGWPSDDYTTIKYLPNGDTAWVRAYNGYLTFPDEAYDLAVDVSGNVYVTGQSRYDYATIKYLPGGDTAWVRRYEGPGGTDKASALAIDGSGNVYVTGWSNGSDFLGYPDYATIKYLPNGDTAWVRRYNGPDNFIDEATSLAVDDSGNVYVTGRSVGSGSYYDYATIKYLPNGDTEWVKKYNGLGNTFDEATSLAVDDSGNVYVTGFSVGSGSDYDYATSKYSPCSSIPGDVNSTGAITLGDIIHLVNYIFDKDKLPCLGSAPGNCWTPNPFCRGDVNISGAISLGDIIHLVNYVFDKDKLPCLGIDPSNCWIPEANGACCLAVP